MANTRVLSQAKILRPYRNPNVWTFLGTSRVIAQYNDGTTQFNLSNTGWMNWANSALRAQGKPIINTFNYGVSGNRTDQFLTNLAAMVASGAGSVLLDGPINDIAQLYPTAGTSAATSLANLKTIIKAANDAGMRVFYVWERGANNYTAQQIGILADFNRLMVDYLNYGDDFRGPPMVVTLDQSPFAVTTSGNGAIALKNSGDGTHDNIVGAQVIGAGLAPIIAPYLNPMPGHRQTSLNQSVSSAANSAYNMMISPGFSGTSGAAGGTGNSGNVPAGWTASQNSLATAAFSIVAGSADANGNTWGNDVSVAVTATGAGTVILFQALTITNVVAGDIIRAGIEYDVAAGATGLNGVQVYLQPFNTQGTPSTTDGSVNANAIAGNDAGGYSNYIAEPPALKLPANQTGLTAIRLRADIVMRGAGSCTVKFRKPWAERATA
ncbi:SGNH/GDSL hydrolase family protein [Bradyrhizobium genosp. A]|uniref:SGNH/GDSL hydrolase family protein n=1 Tax=Bradyrhizobium genosp. A TaxID=83626 RepID=UPI003CEFBCDA